MHLAQQRPVMGSYEHGTEPSDPMKGGEFINCLQLVSQGLSSMDFGSFVVC
jgi:hypothetical protein